jgi:vancomycin permeability regulator SanA
MKLSRRTKKIFFRSALAVVGLFLLGISMLVWAGLHDQLGKADLALVLGSKVETDGAPSPRLKARLDRTLELYRAGYFPDIIVSGGIGKEGFNEAAVMFGYLVRNGVPPAHVIVDSEGYTTFANAQNTRRIARERKAASVLVVTQYFHVPRSCLALRRCGFTTVFSAHAYRFEARDLYSVPRELLGYVSYLLRRFDDGK